MTEFCERLAITDAARAVVDQLRARHGALLFHQSGGCCDGSAPMCFAVGDFRIGSRDVCLGEVHGCKFYMSPEQFQYYENCHTTIDVVPGRGARCKCARLASGVTRGSTTMSVPPRARSASMIGTRWMLVADGLQPHSTTSSLCA